jgi:small subunit ribosomal protein S6
MRKSVYNSKLCHGKFFDAVLLASSVWRRPYDQKEVNIMEQLKGKYETVFIVITELGEEKVQELVAKFKGMIEKNAVVENTDEWGKRRMAYPIDDVNDGYYVVMQYTANRDFPVELERVFNITEGILRSMTIRVDA